MTHAALVFKTLKKRAYKVCKDKPICLKYERFEDHLECNWLLGNRATGLKLHSEEVAGGITLDSHSKYWSSNDIES